MFLLARKLFGPSVFAFLLAAVFSGDSCAQPPVSSKILPVNFLRLGEVALVEEIPDNFYPNRPNKRDGRWRQERWSSLLRRKKHSSLMGDIIRSYEENGLKNPPDGFTYDDSRFLKTFIADCFPWRMEKPWESGKLTEFERIRAIRSFYDQNRAAIERYDVNLPIRIASIQEVQLATYDRANKRFQIKKQPGSEFVKGTRVPLRYRSEEPREILQYLPMSPDKAEAFLAKLDNRRVHLMDSHLLEKLEQHPDVTSGVVGVLSQQELSVFIPGKYDSPVYVKHATRLDKVGNTATPPLRAIRESDDGNLDVAEKMRRICSDLQLFNISGIPISGSLASGVLNPAQKRVFNDGQERLADRLLLGLSVELTSSKLDGRNSRFRRTANAHYNTGIPSTFAR